MLAIQSQSLYFETPGSAQHTFAFNNTVESYGAALQGFDLNYGTGKDHEIESLGAEITNVSLSGDKTAVTVEVKLTINDHSDHVGQGQIDVVAFADVKS